MDTCAKITQWLQRALLLAEDAGAPLVAYGWNFVEGATRVTGAKFEIQTNGKKFRVTVEEVE